MNDNNQRYNYDPSDTNGDTQGFVPANPQYGQPQYSQPQYGQPQYEQQQYAQSQYEQPHYTQPQYQQSQFQGSHQSAQYGAIGENQYQFQHPTQPTNPNQGYPQPTQYPQNNAPYPFVPPTPILYTGQPPIQPRKQLSAGTFLIPLGFMMLHMFVLTLVAVILGFFIGLNAVTASTDMQNLQEQILEQTGKMQIYALLIAMPILIALYILAAKLLKRRSNPYVYFDKPRTGDVLRAIVIGIGCLGIANLIMLLFQELSKNSRFIGQQYDTYIQTTGSMNLDINVFVLIIAICILVPIAEELLFRGLIAGEFRRAMPDWLNILINGTLFALFHMNFIQSIYVFPAGLALTAVGLWSRSIWVPIILHAVYNFCGSVALVLIGDNVELAGLFFLFQMACIVISVFFAIWSYRKRKKEVLMVYP